MAVDPFLALTLGATLAGNAAGLIAARLALRRWPRALRTVLSVVAAWLLGIGAAWLAVRLVFGPGDPDAVAPDLEVVVAAGWGLLSLAVFAIGRAAWLARERDAASRRPAP
jgi:hypothetical protein